MDIHMSYLLYVCSICLGIFGKIFYVNLELPHLLPLTSN